MSPVIDYALKAGWEMTHMNDALEPTMFAHAERGLLVCRYAGDPYWNVYSRIPDLHQVSIVSPTCGTHRRYATEETALLACMNAVELVCTFTGSSIACDQQITDELCRALWLKVHDGGSNRGATHVYWD